MNTPGFALGQTITKQHQPITALPGAPSGSSLRAVERGVGVLLARHDALTVNVRSCGLDVSVRDLDLTQLQMLLLDRRTERVVKDAVWLALVRLARHDGQIWGLACAWLALPGLTRKSRQLRHALTTLHGVSGEDIDSELLAGFLLALVGADTDQGSNVCSRLLESAVRHVRRELDVDAVGLRIRPWGEDAEVEARGGGHPELVLTRAVRQRVIPERDADLIARTRLEAGSLQHEAERASTTVAAVSSRRRRAEHALATALQANLL